MSRIKILVIDDEQSILDLVTAYLRREGYEVYTATDGPAGLKAARAFKPALIVLDVKCEEIEEGIKETNVEIVIGTNVVDLCGFSRLKVFLGKLLGKIPTRKLPPDFLNLTDLLKSPPRPPKVEINPEDDKITEITNKLVASYQFLFR